MTTLTKILRENLLALILVLAGFALTAALYGRMPDPVPTHWNLRGVADGWTPKPWGPLLMPLTAGGLLGLLVVLRLLAPREMPVERFARVYTVLTAAIVAFLTLVTALTSLAAVGAAVNMNRALGIGTGLLFVVMGNFMGKLTRNFFVGIRTPWTLVNDEVWLRTHRLGGKLFVAAGVVTAIAPFSGAGLYVMLAAVLAAAIVSVIYSYVVYRKLSV
jgi:uncharacterized membrane protein